MTDDASIPAATTDADAPGWPQDVASVARRLEAVLLLVDEPHSICLLYTSPSPRD